MADVNVMLVGAEAGLSTLPSLIEQDSGQRVAVEAMAAVGEALARISKRGYHAVVCWADREDELAGVIRIRKADPKLPILLLTSRTDPEFEGLACRMGATKVAWKHHDPGVVSATIRLAVSTGDLAREMKLQSEQARTKAKELSALIRENRRLVETALGAATSKNRSAFLPLVVEDDLDHALLMVRAFGRAKVFTPLPIQKSGEEAIAFLEAASRDRSTRDQLPSVVILDIQLPKKSGFEVLRWIRSQPGLRRLPVVMLTSSANPEHVSRAYELGANSYLLKPLSFDALVELVCSLTLYWGSNQSPEL